MNLKRDLLRLGLIERFRFFFKPLKNSTDVSTEKQKACNDETDFRPGLPPRRSNDDSHCNDVHHTDTGPGLHCTSAGEPVIKKKYQEGRCEDETGQ